MYLPCVYVYTKNSKIELQLGEENGYLITTASGKMDNCETEHILLYVCKKFSMWKTVVRHSPETNIKGETEEIALTS